jgi:TRAP-type mannitol/chloroaromatic compound transport system substrate-binding protein
MKRGSVVALLSTIVLAVGMIAGSVQAADKVYKWKCQSHWPTASSSYEASLIQIIAELKEKTNGRLIIEPYPAGSLVPPKEILNAVKRGMVEMGTGSPAYFRDQVPLSNVATGLPFAFQEVWEVAYFHKFMGFEKMMRDAYAKHGVLYVTEKIYPTELVTKKPIRTAADFDGLKLRSSGTLQIFLTSLGAAASYLPGAELYPALSSGVVEGAHWGAAQGADSMKLYDICKYHMKPPINLSGNDVWLFNQKALDKLPEDLRQILYATLEEHFWKRSNQYLYLEAMALSKAKKDLGVEVVTMPPEESKKLMGPAMKLWDEVAAKSEDCAKGVQMIRDFLKSMGRL